MKRSFLLLLCSIFFLLSCSGEKTPEKMPIEELMAYIAKERGQTIFDVRSDAMQICFSEKKSADCFHYNNEKLRSYYMIIYNKIIK